MGLYRKLALRNPAQDGRMHVRDLIEALHDADLLRTLSRDADGVVEAEQWLDWLEEGRERKERAKPGRGDQWMQMLLQEIADGTQGLSEIHQERDMILVVEALSALVAKQDALQAQQELFGQALWKLSRNFAGQQQSLQQTLTEARTALQGSSNWLAQVHRDQADERWQHLEEIFHKYDLDGSGHLDSHELTKVLKDFAKTDGTERSSRELERELAACMGERATLEATPPHANHRMDLPLSPHATQNLPRTRAHNAE